MKEAIQKAIKGGYRGYLVSLDYDNLSESQVKEMEEKFYKWKEVHLLYPRFWQSLMKGMGREQQMLDVFGNKVFVAGTEDWRIEWHRFIDHIAEGKSIDSFFEELLAK